MWSIAAKITQLLTIVVSLAEIVIGVARFIDIETWGRFPAVIEARGWDIVPGFRILSLAEISIGCGLLFLFLWQYQDWDTKKRSNTFEVWVAGLICLVCWYVTSWIAQTTDLLFLALGWIGWGIAAVCAVGLLLFVVVYMVRDTLEKQDARKSKRE